MRRVKYGLAVFAAIVIGIGMKFYFFSPPVAQAEVPGMDIATMHANAPRDMPRQELDEMARF
jgi:hypothetical protein